MTKATLKVQTYHVTLNGIDRTIKVLATSRRGAYLAALATINVPSNRRPISKSIVLASSEIGATV